MEGDQFLFFSTKLVFFRGVCTDGVYRKSGWMSGIHPGDGWERVWGGVGFVVFRVLRRGGLGSGWVSECWATFRY